MDRLTPNVYRMAIATKIPKDSWRQYIPEDGICQTCNRLKRNHAGVERAIAANGLTRVVDDRVERYGGIPYCICKAAQEAESDTRERLAHLDRQVKTFGTFSKIKGSEEAYEAAWLFAAGTGPNILMMEGGVGRGKSHLLQAIGWQCLDAGISVRYELVADLLERLRRSYNPNVPESYEEVMKVYYESAYLLLDDIGLEKPTDWVIEKITAMVDDRYRNGRRLAVATNKSKTEIASTMGARLASRLWDSHSKVVKLTCSDYRNGGPNDD
jgi:DNA replication protein DnaC